MFNLQCQRNLPDLPVSLHNINGTEGGRNEGYPVLDYIWFQWQPGQSIIFCIFLGTSEYWAQNEANDHLHWPSPGGSFVLNPILRCGRYPHPIWLYLQGSNGADRAWEMVGAAGASHSYYSGFLLLGYFHQTLYNNKLSRRMFSHHEPFLDWGCPTGWGCCYFDFDFLCIGSQRVPKVKFILWSTTTTPSSSFSSFYLLLSHSGFVTSTWTLIHGSCTLLALQNSTLKSSMYYPVLLPLLTPKLEEL